MARQTAPGQDPIEFVAGKRGLFATGPLILISKRDLTTRRTCANSWTPRRDAADSAHSEGRPPRFRVFRSGAHSPCG